MHAMIAEVPDPRVAAVTDAAQPARDPTPPRPALPAWVIILRSAMITMAVILLGLSLNLVVFSRLQHRTAQSREFARLRKELALGVAPTGQADQAGRLLRPGTPVALLEIPSIGLHEVIVEGTSGRMLTSGPGHLRSTVLPGQAGTSVVFGRAGAYGGPFGGIDRLRKGAVITVTTGIGTSKFRVIGHRRAGDPAPPPPASGAGRLTLVTAEGVPFFPSGTMRVDADLEGAAQPTPTLALSAVPRSERPMGIDTGTPWVLAFLLEALILVVVVSALSWRLWGHTQTWIVFLPLTLLIGYHVADQVTVLLPNLL